MDLNDPLDLLMLQHFVERDVLIDIRRRPPRRFNQEDAFELSEKHFIKNFRLSKQLTREVINMVTPHMQVAQRSSAIDIESKVLVSLRLFGLGSYQELIGSNVYSAVSQSSVSRAVNEVINALNQPNILNQWIKFPENINELERLRNRFYNKYQFPGIVGCIDCTHVALVAPHAHDNVYPEHIYINRKNYHSINTQLVCDENLKILNINAQFPGSTHDSHIWNTSQLSLTMENIYRVYNDNPFFLVGDSGYPLRPWIINPIPNAQANSAEERFNEKFGTIRSTIERCNGVLKNRFRCLLKDRVLHYNPLIASKIINSCAVLHNMCINRNIPEPPNDLGEIDWGILEQPAYIANPRNIINQDLLAARNIRQQIVRNYF